MMNDLKNVLYGLLLLAAVFAGHYTTVKGGSDNVQCFAPVDLKKLEK